MKKPWRNLLAAPAEFLVSRLHPLPGVQVMVSLSVSKIIPSKAEEPIGQMNGSFKKIILILNPYILEWFVTKQ